MLLTVANGGNKLNILNNTYKNRQWLSQCAG